MSLIKDELTLSPGNIAVIFMSERKMDQPDYDAMDRKTMKAVSKMDGFIGFESVRDGESAIFISYWQSMDSINVWRNDPLHRQAKAGGKGQWYDAYRTVVCQINEVGCFRR